MKIWCISDTHMKHGFLDVPDRIDMVIHAGDCGTVKDNYQSEQVIKNFLMWFNSLTHIKYKVMIAGNHDLALESGFIKKSDIPESIIYLEHETKEIGGLKIFGSPYTPSFGHGWAYNVKRNKLDAYWTEIQEGTDIIITHGPPLGILDHTESGTSIGSNSEGATAVYSCGDKSLLNHIKRVQPKIHVYGHIHPETRCNNYAIIQLGDLKTRFINAAIVDLDYNIHNNGHIIEI
jgi:Icc-related predicted phosphoesterase